MPDAARGRSWSISEARARLSELLDHVINHGPQAITWRGKEWHRKLTRSGSLAEFFATSPLPESDLDLERPDVEPRRTAPGPPDRAVVRRGQVVIRNVRHFRLADVEVICPWQG